MDSQLSFFGKGGVLAKGGEALGEGVPSFAFGFAFSPGLGDTKVSRFAA